MKGLVIQSRWVDLILEGKKTWELRSTATSIRGDIALIKKGSGHIFGLARISGVRGPLTEQELLNASSKHQVPQEFWQPFEQFKWRYAWELEKVVLLKTPIPYIHPKGAVIWVNLSDEIANALGSGSCISELVLPQNPVFQVADNPGEDTARSNKQTVSKAKPRFVESSLSDEPENSAGSDVREIVLSQGNINNGHFYLRSIKDWLPENVIGGTNKANAAPQSMVIDWGGPELAVSDVAGDKMIFRSRGWVRAFFEKFHLKSGDTLQLIKTGEMSLRIRPAKG